MSVKDSSVDRPKSLVKANITYTRMAPLIGGNVGNNLPPTSRDALVEMFKLTSKNERISKLKDLIRNAYSGQNVPDSLLDPNAYGATYAQFGEAVKYILGKKGDILR